MKYLKGLGLASLLALFGCEESKLKHTPYQPYKGEVVSSILEKKLDNDLWLQVVESERKDLNLDSRYKIFLSHDTGEKYAFYLGVNSETECRNISEFGILKTKIKTSVGETDLCNYIPK